jgi:hypothetical protein
VGEVPHTLLGAYDRLTPSVLEALPEPFIIKANHGCKWNQVVEDKRTLDVTATVDRFSMYCRQRYGAFHGERHYEFIKPKIVIEQLLQGNGGGLPWDYNFFCYNGPAGFDYNFSIASPQGDAAAFTKDWEMLDCTVPAAMLEPHLKPKNFDEMARVARDLSADFDFVRVDLYTVGERVYFGELTCTPSAGYGPIANERRRKMRTRCGIWMGEIHCLQAPPPLQAAHGQLPAYTGRIREPTDSQDQDKLIAAAAPLLVACGTNR